jgi:hypothetical protein
MRKLTVTIILVFLCTLNTQSAYAQKTGQRSSRPQVIVMIVFSAVAMKLLSYMRIP